MKGFEAPDYSMEILTKFFERHTRKVGIISKRSLETLEQVTMLYRPFRKILFELETASGRKKAVSFIDEQLSPSIADNDHRFLLWRPRLASFNIEDVNEDHAELDNVESIKQIVDDLILDRWNGQELDDELHPKLRSLQADPLTTITFLVPRSPYGIKREDKILAERNEIHSFVIASSLVTNCSPKDIMLSAEVEDRVFVETVSAQYRSTTDDSQRTLYLETPGSNSLQDALKSGRALTRICDLYPDCIETIAQSYVKSF